MDEPSASGGPRRPEIEASWRRSARSGVKESSLRPGEVEVDPEHRLLRVAGPVLDRLAAELEGTGVSVVLTDARASILARRAGHRRLDDALDGVGVAPGFSYAEEVVGTNGMGTAAEERRPVRVLGAEHYAEHLRDLTCVGVPIVHPVTGVVEGVLDLTCFNPDASPMLLPFVLEAARDVQQRLGAISSAREQLLLEHFLRATRRTARPVVSVGDQVVITNGPAAQLLGPADHPLLWEAARAGLQSTERADLSLALSGGLDVRVRCDGVRDGGTLIGATLALEVAPRDAPADTSSLPGVVGRSSAWARTCGDAHRAAGAADPILVFGPRGSGRTAVASAVLALRGYDVVGVVDAAVDPAGAVAAIRDPRPCVVRHADVLTSAALADVVRDGGRRTALTADGPPIARRHTVASVASAALRDRLDDVELLVDALIARRRPESSVRVTPALLHALLRAPWPGNVAELDELVGELLARRTVGDLTLDDLPVSRRPASAPRPLSAMERAECEAIVAALDRCDGNKVEAARDLGIARSTLYRKLFAYGIDPVHTGF